MSRLSWKPGAWNYFYSYIADPIDTEEVDEFIHLETMDLEGRLLEPRAYKSRAARLMVSCEKPTPPGDPIVQRPVIGYMTVRARHVDAHVRVPPSHLARLATIVSTGRVALIRLMVPRQIKGRVMVRSFTATTYARLD